MLCSVFSIAFADDVTVNAGDINSIYVNHDAKIVDIRVEPNTLYRIDYNGDDLKGKLLLSTLLSAQTNQNSIVIYFTMNTYRSVDGIKIEY